MTIVSWGFQGTIDEIQWAKHAQLLGNEYAVNSPTALAPVAVAGARQVRIPVGIAHGKGITSEVTAAEVITLATPAVGQWYLIVLRRVWASKTAVLTALAGPTTVMPLTGGPPAAFPAERQASPGSTDDMPVCWAHVNGTDTTMVVIPLLQLAGASRAPRRCSSDAMRDALLPSPIQGDRVIRDDLGWEEAYYAAYNATTNPGGITPAGWYPVDGRLPSAFGYKAAVQSVAAESNITWSSTKLHGGFKMAAEGFVVPYAGDYLLSGALRLAGAGTGSDRVCYITRNGDASTAVVAADIRAQQIYDQVLMPSTAMRLAKDDVIKMRAKGPGNAGNPMTDASFPAPVLVIKYLGPSAA